METYFFIDAVVSSISFKAPMGPDDCRVIGSEPSGVVLNGVPPPGIPLSAFKSHSTVLGAPPPVEAGACDWDGACGSGSGCTGGAWEIVGVAAGLLRFARSCARLAAGVAVGVEAGAGAGAGIAGAGIGVETTCGAAKGGG